MCKVRFVGLDVHADTIAVAVAEPGGLGNHPKPANDNHLKTGQRTG
jgi:hypothetical protein